MRRDLQDNEITNVEVIEAAVGDVPGMLTITEDGPWSAILPDVPIKCRAVTLGDYAGPDVRFVKIDVQGREPNVLAGASRLLATAQPLMAIEFNTWTLLLQHHDPIVFAEALLMACDVIAIYHGTVACTLPSSAEDFVHVNLTQHGCVPDLPLRPRTTIPELAALTQTSRTRQQKSELEALRAPAS